MLEQGGRRSYRLSTLYLPLGEYIMEMQSDLDRMSIISLQTRMEKSSYLPNKPKLPEEIL